VVTEANKPWYRETQTFIAIAALIVSLSAVVVGIYEASLQRAHDRAEVWPHLEIATFVNPQGASISLESTGLGPAIVNSVAVSVDGQRRKNWAEAMAALLGSGRTLSLNTTTVEDHALRPGDKVEMIGIARGDIPPNFWEWIGRVGVNVCYESAFHEHWTVRVDRLGGNSSWAAVPDCPPRGPGEDF
jgi:hypothetical protein